MSGEIFTYGSFKDWGHLWLNTGTWAFVVAQDHQPLVRVMGVRLPGHNNSSTQLKWQAWAQACQRRGAA
eukprot:1532486-Prorocentrum_lima.AAC.1